jgi:ABC-type lipopolysaccharide export system ATPase subunit
MITHTVLNEVSFSKAIKETTTFKNFEKFKQGIVMKRQNITRLHDYYGQATRLGIDYLKQNPNMFSNDVKMIEEVICSDNTN